MTKSQFTDI